LEFSIIIPTKNRSAILQQSLQQALAAVRDVRVEFIIINDGTDDIRLPEVFPEQISVYKNPKSGVASARNLGAEKAAYSHIIFMDDDMWMQPGNITALQQAIAEYPNACINLNWIYPPALSKQIASTKFGRYLEYYGFTSLKGWNRGAPWSDTEVFETAGITSQFLYMPKAVFAAVGGYNENFPHAGFEDFDFAERLKKAGVKFYIQPVSSLYHNEADRVEARSWLARKKRGGETRKYAVSFGYQQLALHYPVWKSIFYRICIIFYPLLFAIERFWPNLPALDKGYFQLINLLLGVHSFEGYHKKEQQ
jgi:GT2 family glycosyltransferase